MRVVRKHARTLAPVVRLHLTQDIRPAETDGLPNGIGINVVRLESRLIERRLTQPRRLQPESSASKFRHFRLIRHQH